MAALHVGKSSLESDNNSAEENIMSDDDSDNPRLSETGSDASSEEENDSSDGKEKMPKSGMANVIAKILSKDISSSNKVLLSKGKTNREILKDISKRKKERGDDDDTADKEKDRNGSEKELLRIEKRKLWESMARRKTSEMDFVREAKLRKIATQGMVQLFQSVHEHQKLLNQKIASEGSSERKKDKITAEFTKGKFLDLLKSKNLSENKTIEDKTEKKDTPKWKILQDDFMMGARMKDWDKEEDDDDEIEEGIS